MLLYVATRFRVFGGQVQLRGRTLRNSPCFALFQVAWPKVRAVTPDSWRPRQARDNIDRELPDFKFELDMQNDGAAGQD
jgi:hypothetical protein